MRSFQLQRPQYYPRSHSISYINPAIPNPQPNYQPNIHTIKVINPPQINKRYEAMLPLIKSNYLANGINPREIGIIKNYPNYSSSTKLVEIPQYSNRTYLSTNPINQMIKTKNVTIPNQNGVNSIVINPATVNIVNRSMNPPNNMNNLVTNQNVVRIINGNPNIGTANYMVTTITSNVGDNLGSQNIINSQSQNPNIIKIISTVKSENNQIQNQIPNQIQIQNQVPNQIQIQSQVPNQIQIQSQVPNPIQSQVPNQIQIQSQVPNQIQIQNQVPNQIQIQSQVPNGIPTQTQAPNPIPNYATNQNSYSFIPNLGIAPQTQNNAVIPQTNIVNTSIANIPPNPLNNLREPNESINLNEFKILNEIGQGTFGKIYKVIWAVNNKVYALKKEILRDMEGVHIRQHRNQTIRSFIGNTNCNGVVKIYGNLTIPNGPEFHYYELMELCDRDFEQEIKSRAAYNQFYTEQEMYAIMLQLISTLSLLQKSHITHRDIKPQNILISNGVYKLCDFGDIRFMQREGIVVQRVRGSELYMSPILFNGLRAKQYHVRHNTYKSDVFSLGMCFFLAGCLSYNGPVDIRELTDMNQKLFVLNKYLSGRYSQKLIQILNLMLLTEEENRPDFISLENAIRQYGL